MSDLQSTPPKPSSTGRAAQPSDQRIPTEMLVAIVELDRLHRSERR